MRGVLLAAGRWALRQWVLMSGQRLEYASANVTRKPWGPFFIKPSRRSVVLIGLTLVTVAWLALRHNAWRLVADVRVPLGYERFDHFAFTPGHRLVTCYHAALVWDGNTGRVLHELGRSEMIGQPCGPLTFNNSTEVLFLQRNEGEVRAHLYDVESGRLLKDVALAPEGFADCELLAAAPAGHRLLIDR
ncbi:MAG: hypothetical protein JWN40_179, partial [Phycisphaerales bacterium]|nr:hypothetical protein [Phycisphaerales bacterium]